MAASDTQARKKRCSASRLWCLVHLTFSSNGIIMLHCPCGSARVPWAVSGRRGMQGEKGGVADNRVRGSRAEREYFNQ